MIDYTPNSFNDTNAFDLRYNFERNPVDISIMMPGGFNKEDIRKIDDRVKLGDDNPFDPPKLIDRGNFRLPYGTNNDPGYYEKYFDEKYKLTMGEDKPVLAHIKPKFWIEDPFNLFRADNYYKIIPTKHMNKIEVLNSLARFFFYLLGLFFLLGAKSEYMFIPIVAHIIIIVLFLFHKYSKEKRPHESPENRKEDFSEIDGNVCQMPTNGNPFMNVTMADLMDNRNRPPACSVRNPLVKEEIDKKFNQDIIKDIEDIFDRDHSSRQFYTTPATTIPNDQTGFAKWLNDSPPTCKENQLNCLKYEDIRYTRFNPYVDRMEKEVEEGH
jgi:hypothetical protein